jgi:rhodanese-related sulfurtransferase
MAAIPVERLKAELESPDGAWPRRDWALFDIREAGEADAGHIPGATFLPRRQIEFRIRALVPAADTRIVIYDADDGRALLAAKTLNALGYARVDWLDGGLPAWRARGGEIAQGSNVPCKDFGENVHVSAAVPYMTAQALKARLDSGDRVVICDVRTPEEHKASCIPAGHTSPSFELALHADDLRRDYDLVVVNCAGRTRSIIGTSTLRLMGIDNVVALENGTMGWRLAGYDLERGSTRQLAQPSTESVALARRAAEALAREAGAVLADTAAIEGRQAARGRGNVYLFDVRPLASYTAGHIPGAIALPGGQAVQRADDFTAVPGAEIAFVDDGDARALLTAYWYRRMGFPNVSVLDGGMPAWRKAGKPVETGRGRDDPAGVEAARTRLQAVKPADLAAILARGRAVVIDVGTSRQFAGGHLPGAQWVPRGWLEFRMAARAELGEVVVVTAADPAQAILAGATLADLGYRRVLVLDGSPADWKRAGGEIESGLPDGVSEPGDVVDPPYAKGRESMLRYLEWETKLGHKYEGNVHVRQGADARR